MPKKIKRKKQIKTAPDRVVYVNSHTYGRHTRAARGSKTQAVVNDVLAAHAEKTSVINAAAKSVYDVLKIYGEGFREGQLWQNILSRMRKAKGTGFNELLSSLRELELNSRYGIKRFGNVPFVTIDNKKKTLDIKMKPVMPPHLHKNDNCYQYSLIVLLFNSKGICVQHSVQQTEWRNKNEKVYAFDFSFEKPARAKYYLLCLELKGGKDGIATDTLASRGIVIV
jgi:hypothetical protein